MSVERVEVLVEEPSMEAALQAILPKILGETSFHIYPYQCKDELLTRLPERLRGYANWLPRSWRIVVVVDRDDDDCVQLKEKLEAMAADAGLATCTSAGGLPYTVVNRLAIEEMEAWYFGDWVAVLLAYPRASKSIPSQARYRDPDKIAGGTWEAFERVLQRAGYFKGGLRKIEAARQIAAHMEAAQNTSRSFQALRDTLIEMVQP
ncbi:MAG: DUF4276 family protein [bacterium]